jgi:hypothetical protein
MKQDPFSGVYRALSPKELAEMFMNPNAPKTEAEHWAVREIEKQRAENERLREALREFACSCSSLGKCESLWNLDGECRYLTAQRALEGKP